MLKKVIKDIDYGVIGPAVLGSDKGQDAYKHSRKHHVLKRAGATLLVGLGMATAEQPGGQLL